MIGGYLYRNKNEDISNRLNTALDESYNTVSFDDLGTLFYNNPFSDFETTLCTSESLSFLTQDLLTTCNSSGDYCTLAPDQLPNRLPPLPSCISSAAAPGHGF